MLGDGMDRYVQASTLRAATAYRPPRLSYRPVDRDCRAAPEGKARQRKSDWERRTESVEQFRSEERSARGDEAGN
jgi:hypothetical protein